MKGVEEILKKNKEVAESKGIKAHFRMDESGLLTLDKVHLFYHLFYNLYIPGDIEVIKHIFIMIFYLYGVVK